MEILKDIAEETNQRREGLLRCLERHDFRPPADEDIDGLVKAVLEDFAIPDAIGDIEQLGLQMAAVIRRMLDEAMAPSLLESGTSESPTDPLTIANFMKFVCGHNTYDEAMKAKSGGGLLLRPYELFLYAHQRDFETNRLTKRRADLGQDFVPQPEYSSSLSIMVAHGGAEDYLEKWAEEDKERGRQRKNLEKQTEERLALRRLGEVDKRQAALKEAERKLPTKKAAKAAASKNPSTKTKAARKRVNAK